MELAASFRAGSAEADVGGDWYDVFTLPDGRVVLVVGDVMGKGVVAAAGMGRLRSALRALAHANPLPEAVLQGSTGSSPPPRAPTRSRRWSTCWSTRPHAGRPSGGGPPPARAPPGGPAARAGRRRIGVDALGWPEPRAQRTLELGPGDVLIGLTDGLVERRGSDLDEGLAEVLARSSRGRQPGRAGRADQHRPARRRRRSRRRHAARRTLHALTSAALPVCTAAPDVSQCCVASVARSRPQPRDPSAGCRTPIARREVVRVGHGPPAPPEFAAPQMQELLRRPAVRHAVTCGPRSRCRRPARPHEGRAALPQPGRSDRHGRGRHLRGRHDGRCRQVVAATSTKRAVTTKKVASGGGQAAAKPKPAAKPAAKRPRRPRPRRRPQEADREAKTATPAAAAKKAAGAPPRRRPRARRPPPPRRPAPPTAPPPGDPRRPSPTSRPGTSRRARSSSSPTRTRRTRPPSRSPPPAPRPTRSRTTSSRSARSPCSTPSRRSSSPSASRPACSPRRSSTRARSSRPSSRRSSTGSPRTAGGPRTTCSRPTCAWSSRWPSATPAAACSSST